MGRRVNTTTPPSTIVLQLHKSWWEQEITDSYQQDMTTGCEIKVRACMAHIKCHQTGVIVVGVIIVT